MLFNLPNNYVLLFQTYFLTPSCFFKLQDENPDQAISEENAAEERPEENIPEAIEEEIARIEQNQQLFNWIPFTIETDLRRQKGTIYRTEDQYLYHKHTKQGNRIFLKCRRNHGKKHSDCKARGSIDINTNVFKMTKAHTHGPENTNEL